MQTNATRGITQKDNELVRRIGELAASKSKLTKEDYQDLALGFSRLSGKTSDITTAIELHRSAGLCAVAAGMPELARTQAVKADALTKAFNSEIELRAFGTPGPAEFELALRKVARFNPAPGYLLREGNAALQATAGMAMIVNSDPEEKVVPRAVADLGIAGLFRRAGQPEQSA
ncbi:MAG: hypothetical protein KGH94_04425 [Candidatus Micrarchaeota archaeon]|nr:hypothetical protein [Candidatus Micrarchaeota archaeon]